MTAQPSDQDPAAEPRKDKGVPDPDASTDADHDDALVDEGVDESFPASDPPASHQFT